MASRGNASPFPTAVCNPPFACLKLKIHPHVTGAQQNFLLMAEQEEHGGFGHDDTNVILLLSHPDFSAKTVTLPVETTQVAPTILKALGLDPRELQAVRKEGTQVLPGVKFDRDDEE